MSEFRVFLEIRQAVLLPADIGVINHLKFDLAFQFFGVFLLSIESQR